MTVWRIRLLRRLDAEVRPSIEKRIEAGTVLFRAGDHCHAVALIHEGEIELLADQDGRAVRVATRGRGAFVGDDEVLGDGVWRRTARASRRSRVEMLARDVFIERFAERPPRSVATRSGRLVHLLPASPGSAAALPAAGIDVTDFPFRVGRASVDLDDAVALGKGLLLADERPYHLSRRQFVILQGPDGIGLSDPGSRLGTFVDGRRLVPEPLPLRAGEVVEIRAGGHQSPVRFELRVD
jgi:CRP/FNR family transcriptional regulator, cyclic AMP receptor protein